MKRSLIALLMLALAACKETPDTTTPVSVRGWIHDVKGAKREEIVDMEIQRRAALFQSTSVWVEENQYASGGIAENGAFIILDVQPNKSTLGFNAPGAETAKLVLEGIPGAADVFIPDIILEPNGATVRDPKQILVRVPADVDKATLSGKTAKVANYVVPIIHAPLSDFMDRREYPNPGGIRPVATVRE